MSPHLSALGTASLLLALVGCSSLPRSNDLPELSELDASAGQRPVCIVDNRVGAKSKRTEVPVTGEMRVQDALDAMERIPRGSLEVYIIRPTPGRPGPGLKLGCLYNASARRVSMETDYAVMPGDHIVLRKGDEGPAGELIGALLGPLSGS